MNTDKHHIAVIVGSTREGRLAPAVAAWVLDRIAEHGGFEVAYVDPADPARAGDRAARIARADGFVVVTPEYNHSFAAPLKQLLDDHRDEWHAKPFGFVSYGGVSGGLRAVEHLRAVVAELHGVSLRDGVALPLVWEHVGDKGLQSPPGADQAARLMLDRLAWWTAALEQARTRAPYVA